MALSLMVKVALAVLFALLLFGGYTWYKKQNDKNPSTGGGDEEGHVEPDADIPGAPKVRYIKGTAANLWVQDAFPCHGSILTGECSVPNQEIAEAVCDRDDACLGYVKPLYDPSNPFDWTPYNQGFSNTVRLTRKQPGTATNRVKGNFFAKPPKKK